MIKKSNERFWIPNPSHAQKHHTDVFLSPLTPMPKLPLMPRNQSGQLHKELISCMPSENFPSPSVLPPSISFLSVQLGYSVEDNTVICSIISANLGYLKELWSFPSIPSWIVIVIVLRLIRVSPVFVATANPSESFHLPSKNQHRHWQLGRFSHPGLPDWQGYLGCSLQNFEVKNANMKEHGIEQHNAK